MKIAIDPGHGMSNRKPGVYDPGAVSAGQDEATIALQYALTLKYTLVFGNAGMPCFLTRSNHDDPAPVGTRAQRAEEAGCNRFISLHLNSSVKVASGIEVLWRAAKDKPLALALLKALVRVTGFRSRGIKQRTDLAVLRFAPGPAVLIELGFINNPQERAWLLQRDNRIAVCQAIVEAIRA
ncbi:MAG: N-acetylmuramoyl-L-alanine amidase [bacterium]